MSCWMADFGRMKAKQISGFIYYCFRKSGAKCGVRKDIRKDIRKVVRKVVRKDVRKDAI